MADERPESKLKSEQRPINQKSGKITDLSDVRYLKHSAGGDTTRSRLEKETDSDFMIEIPRNAFPSILLIIVATTNLWIRVAMFRDATKSKWMTGQIVDRDYLTFMRAERLRHRKADVRLSIGNCLALIFAVSSASGRFSIAGIIILAIFTLTSVLMAVGSEQIRRSYDKMLATRVIEKSGG